MPTIIVSASSGSLSPITLQPGGRYQFDNYNFSGSTDTHKMYGCDGVNKAFEFDGTTYVPIHTGMTTDTPSFIKAHKNQLFLSFRGSSQNSGVGFPYIWTTVTGAAEIGAGDTITGYATLPGESLAIASRNSLRNLSGSTTDDFLLKTISDERGCIPYTMQTVGNGFCMDDAGIVRITPTQSYGDFSEGIVSRRVQPLIDGLQATATASVVYRHRNQYRVFSDDGSGLIMATSTDGKGRPTFQFTEFDYNSGRTSDLINVTCACSGEDSTGKDVVFFGADNGYVYQCEKGTSFDGNDIESYIRLPFGDARSPRVKKHYRKIVMEMECQGFMALRFHPDFSYGSPAIASHQLETQDIVGSGAYWGSSAAVWGSFFYDSPIVSTPQFKIAGSGTNMSLLMYAKSAYHAQWNLQGCIVHYSPRKLVR